MGLTPRIDYIGIGGLAKSVQDGPAKAITEHRAAPEAGGEDREHNQGPGAGGPTE